MLNILASRTGKHSGKVHIQVGDKPGWKTPALNFVVRGETFSVNITAKAAARLKALGISVEG